MKQYGLILNQNYTEKIMRHMKFCTLSWENSFYFMVKIVNKLCGCSILIKITRVKSCTFLWPSICFLVAGPLLAGAVITAISERDSVATVSNALCSYNINIFFHIWNYDLYISHLTNNFTFVVPSIFCYICTWVTINKLYICMYTKLLLGSVTVEGKLIGWEFYHARSTTSKYSY